MFTDKFMCVWYSNKTEQKPCRLRMCKARLIIGLYFVSSLNEWRKFIESNKIVNFGRINKLKKELYLLFLQSKRNEDQRLTIYCSDRSASSLYFDRRCSWQHSWTVSNPNVNIPLNTEKFGLVWKIMWPPIIYSSL